MKETTWKKNWSGEWSFHECFYYGKNYTVMTKQALGVGIPSAAFISRKGKTDCYLKEDEVEVFGKNIAKKLENDPKLAEKWGREAKALADEILEFIEKCHEKEITSEVYEAHWQIIYRYAIIVIAIKAVGDYLPKTLKERLLPFFTEVRKYGEPVYIQSALFIKKFAEQVAKQTRTTPQCILALTDEEVQKYFFSGELPDKDLLAERYEQAYLLMTKKEKEYESGEAVNAFEQKILGSLEVTELHGTSAYPGKVAGRIRIVDDPQTTQSLPEDTVLVTGMTRPEYLHLMKQAIAIITDAGGILSHAAITSRELKIPCIVGTRIATKALKNGDIVEVDANKGIVKVLE